MDKAFRYWMKYGAEKEGSYPYQEKVMTNVNKVTTCTARIEIPIMDRLPSWVKNYLYYYPKYVLSESISYSNSMKTKIC